MKRVVFLLMTILLGGKVFLRGLNDGVVLFTSDRMDLSSGCLLIPVQ